MNDKKRLDWLEDNTYEAIRLFQNELKTTTTHLLRDAIDEEMNKSAINDTSLKSKTVIKSVKKKKPFNIFKTLF